MKTKNLLVALSVAMLSTWSAYAQEVERLTNAYGAVINCEGMPLLSYYTETKGTTVEELEANKDAVYKRFTVAFRDRSSSALWSEAFSVCTTVGDGWRLPTQRELMLIWILKDELVKSTTQFVTFAADYYWSSTQAFNSAVLAHVVHLGAGISSKSYIDGRRRVRCIKELP